jgi:hypothetical protein
MSDLSQTLLQCRDRVQQVLLGEDLTYLSPGLKGQYTDELILGAELQVVPDFKLGLSYTRRVMPRVIEDISTDGGNHYLITNPGEDFSGEAAKQRAEAARLMATGDADDAALADVLLGRADQLEAVSRFEKPARNYDAVVLSAVRHVTVKPSIGAPSRSIARTENASFCAAGAACTASVGGFGAATSSRALADCASSDSSSAGGALVADSPRRAACSPSFRASAPVGPCRSNAIAPAIPSASTTSTTINVRDPRASFDRATAQPSATATAAAMPASCVIAMWIRAMPFAAAIFAATPCRRTPGADPRSRTTSMSRQRTPRAQPVPRTFMTASLTAKRPA